MGAHGTQIALSFDGDAHGSTHARLEADVDHPRADANDIKSDVRALRDKADALRELTRDAFTPC